MIYTTPEFPTIKITGGISLPENHVYLDGVELKGVTCIKFESCSHGLNKVQIEMIANVDIDTESVPIVTIGDKKYMLTVLGEGYDV